MSIETIRHSLSHILANAVKGLYSGVKFGIGPAIENGFYYDFDNLKISDSDLPKIEKKMKELIEKKIKFEKIEMDADEAIKLFNKLNQPYKVELIKDIKEKTNKKRVQVSCFKFQEFVDLCKGPHIKSTNEIPADAFKLTKTAGAYWKGDEKNPMLTRIYGLAFETKKELDNYLKLQEETEKRDHRKLGKELDLFYFSELVGPGLPLFTPKGTIIKEELQKKIEKICRRYGFEKVITPHLAKMELYELSGHTKKFKEELFHVSSSRGHKFVIKPVQCPHQTQIYASRPRSYKDLPIRYMESEKQYRAEKPGEVGGLNRVYAITVEDGHSFCAISQVKDEIKKMINIIKEFYKPLGLLENYWVSLSTRDKKHPEKYIGEKRDWDLCEKILKEVSDEMKLKAKKCEGEAALYGPKIDFMFKGAMGKEIQIPTVQIDFATPKRFNLTYIDKNGKEKTPVMVHRAILGSYERLIALLIEHFNGAFPLWLSPVQVCILPISDKHNKYAHQIAEKFQVSGFRFQVIDENETVSKKIRGGEIQKIPYLLVVGDKEIQNKTVRVRQRGKGDIGEMKTDEFIEKIKKELETKK